MKYFVVSDIHGYYDQLIKALKTAGFDKDNPDHCLVSCGDHFDRGMKPVQVMRFLRSLQRKVLIKGNHEQLLVDLCERGYPKQHDFHNGTVTTIYAFSSKNDDFPEACQKTLSRTEPFLSETVNYFETEHYIFVHSWIPIISKDDLLAYCTSNRQFEYNPNWREASQKEWDDAMWGNPWDMAAHELNRTGKTIVFGHWSTNEAWAVLENRNVYGADAKFEPYYGDGFIAIDACTALSNTVNCVVIED